MKKVVLFISMSLDGYLADPKGSIDWLSDEDIKKEDKSYDDFYKDVTSVVLGRVTYDQITTSLSPDHYPYDNVNSFVLTQEDREDLDRIFFIKDSASDLVRREKEKGDGVLWIVGGASIIQELVGDNLIDEYQIAIMPTLLGDGIKLFKTFENKISLKIKLLKHINDMVYVNYVRKEENL